MMSDVEVAFRFDARTHEYIRDTGEVARHITGMLIESGWVDPTHYTEESRVRGSAVHRLTADYDLGALTDIKGCSSPYKGWLLGHVAAVDLLKPEWIAIEEPVIHPVFGYGGRPDRTLRLDDALSVWEEKSGAKDKAHAIQTALQAILVAPQFGIPAEAIRRYAIYVKENARFQVEEHVRRQDFTEARRIIRSCCG